MFFTESIILFNNLNVTLKNNLKPRFPLAILLNHYTFVTSQRGVPKFRD
jgi:hypothetical protein